MATAGSLENTYNLSVNVPIRSIIITTRYLAIIGSFHRRWFTCITIQDIEKDKIRLIPLLVLPWAFTSRKIIKNQILARVAIVVRACPNGHTILTGDLYGQKTNRARLIYCFLQWRHKPTSSYVLRNTGMSAFKCRRLLSGQFGRNCQINECRK